MSGDITVWKRAKGCCKDPIRFKNSSESIHDGSQFLEIRSSVGRNGRNLPDDVRKVQAALNNVYFNHGGPRPLLDEDSVCGRLTKKAIQDFQLHHFGWKFADGRVDPNKMTIKKLHEYSKHYTPPMLRVARVEYLSTRMLQLASSAYQNVSTAMYVVNSNVSAPSMPPVSPPSQKDTILFNVNKHFKIDKFLVSEQKGALRRIQQIYQKMVYALLIQATPGEKSLFKYCPPIEEGQAFCFQGGFYTAGETLTMTSGFEMEKDKIYLCQELDKHSDEQIIYIIIHELAHFVGRYREIDHFGVSGSISSELNPKGILPHERVRNASSYSNFAFETHLGRLPVF